MEKISLDKDSFLCVRLAKIAEYIRPAFSPSWNTDMRQTKYEQGNSIYD